VSPVQEPRWAILGWLGIAAGVLALAAALLPARLLPLVAPEKPLEQSIIERAKAFRDRATQLLKGIEAPAKPRPLELRDVLGAVTVSLGFAAFVLGILSFVRHEALRAAAGAAMLGTAAIAFEQFSYAVVMLVAMVILLITLGRVRNP
jgi:uncharacterized membrane protein